MYSFRMSIQASVCVSITAKNEEEAAAVCAELVSDLSDGVDLPLDGDLEARLYLSEKPEDVDVEDFEELGAA